MELPRLASTLVVLALAPAAFAQPAVERDPTERSASRHAVHTRHGNGALGMRLGGGVAYANGVSDAWLARLDYEMFLHLPPRGTVGGSFGFGAGLDYWRGEPDDWGIGFPFTFFIGVRAPLVRAHVGWGFDYLIVDQVDDDTGVGLFAPLALLNAGIDIRGWTLAADARVLRRWQIGAPDHTQWMFSLMIGGTLEAKQPVAATR